ncbi:hypothetical protein [Leyella stercorea]|uniref:hypothetical protein n=1 Tax=Leyella stercorea TaxID=363265 RepID=UPI0024303141|nr:hypothetical protein [Leyella stercorea]
MKKGIYEQPRITIYEVETTAILAGSGEHKVPSEKSGFSLDRESEELTSGDQYLCWLQWCLLRAAATTPRSQS